VIHPQFWPQDLDYTGKRIVVIGSGATAVTLVPALAERAVHVTMLQRSPAWMAMRPSIDPVATRLRRRLPRRVLAHALTRWKNILYGMWIFPELCRRATRADRRLPAVDGEQAPAGRL
jgi:cation diffusion facilitator CzcD-associated flavoprotein CzcO